MNTTGRLL